MPSIHLIERENLISRVSGPQTEYESGCWKLSEAEAAGLVGGQLFFHEHQIEASFYGGVIAGFRVQKT
jgi:hypothetical protein